MPVVDYMGVKKTVDFVDFVIVPPDAEEELSASVLVSVDGPVAEGWQGMRSPVLSNAEDNAA
jgi:hypothetical protein